MRATAKGLPSRLDFDLRHVRALYHYHTHETFASHPILCLPDDDTVSSRADRPLLCLAQDDICAVVNALKDALEDSTLGFWKMDQDCAVKEV